MPHASLQPTNGLILKTDWLLNEGWLPAGWQVVSKEQPRFSARPVVFNMRKSGSNNNKTQSRNSLFQWMWQKTQLFSACVQKISRRCSFWDGLWPEVARLICWAMMWEMPQILLSTFTGRSEVRLNCWTSAWSREGFSDLPQDSAGGRTPAVTGASTQNIQFLKSRCMKPSCLRVSHTTGLLILSSQFLLKNVVKIDQKQHNVAWQTAPNLP